MKKSELIEAIAQESGLDKDAASRALAGTIAAITKALKNNDSVSLIGFGTFYVGERAARIGRNPRTKEELKIPAARVPKFRVGKALKDAVALPVKKSKK